MCFCVQHLVTAQTKIYVMTESVVDLVFFSLVLCGVGEPGGVSEAFSACSSLTADSCPGSVFILKEDARLAERGDAALGLFVGEILWADGQLCWFRHTEQRGLMGRQTCCPKPTRSQLISLHSSLQKSVMGKSQGNFLQWFFNHSGAGEVGVKGKHLHNKFWLLFSKKTELLP